MFVSYWAYHSDPTFDHGMLCRHRNRTPTEKMHSRLRFTDRAPWTKTLRPTKAQLLIPIWKFQIWWVHISKQAFLYTYKHTCIYYLHIHIPIYIYVNTYTYTCVYIYIWYVCIYIIYIYTYTCTFTYTHTHTIHIHIHIHIIYIYIYIYIHIYIYIYTYTYRYRSYTYKHFCIYTQRTSICGGFWFCHFMPLHATSSGEPLWVGVCHFKWRATSSGVLTV